MTFLFVLAFLLGNLWLPTLGSPSIHVTLLDLVVALAFLKRRLIAKPIWAFLGVGLLSLLVNIPHYGLIPTLVGSLYLLRWVIYSSMVFTTKHAIMLLLALVVVITSLGQYFLSPDMRWLKFFGWDDHYYRVVGTFLDPGFMGILLVFTLVYLTVSGRKFLWSIAYLALALTYSRSSYLAFLTAMAFLAWQKFGWKWFLGILLLFTMTVILLPRSSSGEGVKLERTFSISARFASWQTAWNIFLQHPVLGVGFNTYRYAQGASPQSRAGGGSDSSLLFVAATTGIMGLVVYLWYLRNLLLLSTEHLVLRTSLVALLVHSLFLNSLFYPAVMAWLSLLAASAPDSRNDQSQSSRA